MNESESKTGARTKTALRSTGGTRMFLWTTVFVVSLVLAACGGSCASCCVGDVDVGPSPPTSGRIRIAVGGFPDPSGSPIFLASRYEGSSGSNNIDFSRTIEITGAGHIETYPERGVEAGAWSITVRTDPAGAIGAWSANCTGAVTVGNTTSFSFTFNQNGCTTS